MIQRGVDGFLLVGAEFERGSRIRSHPRKTVPEIVLL
jgi:hypothetical protein